jgi:colicin import membrane protein
MDDEKSIAEKLTDAITKATDTVKSTMSNIVDTASQAAQYAMENNAERMSGQTAAEFVPGQIAATATDAAAMPAPLVAIQPAPKKRAPRTKLSSSKILPANKPVAKKAVKKSAPKKSKKGVKKSAKKSAKNSTGKKTAKRIAKKSAKKARKKTKKKTTKSKR